MSLQTSRLPTFSMASTQETEKSHLNFIPIKCSQSQFFLTVQMTLKSNCTHEMIKSNYKLFDILSFSQELLCDWDMIAHKRIQASKCISLNKPILFFCGQNFNARIGFQFVKFLSYMLLLYGIRLPMQLVSSFLHVIYVTWRVCPKKQDFLAVDFTPAVKTYNLT